MNGPVFTSSKSPFAFAATGWPLLAVPDEHGRIGWPDEKTSVRQMIEVILRTSPGEQLMHDRFGAGLERMIHEPNSVATRARIHEIVSSALAAHENRIMIDHIAVAAGEQPNIVEITVQYRHKIDGSPALIRAAANVGEA